MTLKKDEKFKKEIIFIGSLPPPIGGATVKNSILLESLEKKGLNVKKINIMGSKYLLLKYLISLFFDKNKKVVMALSSRGRLLFVPYAYFLIKINAWGGILLPVGGKIDDEITLLPYPLNRLYLEFLKSYDQIYVEPNQLKKKLNNVLEKNNVSRLPNFKERPNKLDKNFNKEKFKVVYLGKMKKEKGIFDLVKAIEKLKEEDYKNIELHFYGMFLDKNDQKKFGYLINGKDYITYHGSLDPSRINDELTKYDVFVFPTQYETEGFPGVILDAFFAGLPVIASNWRYRDEIVKNNTNGLHIETKNPEDIANKIKVLYEDEELLQEMSKNAYEMSEEYDVENVIDGLLDDLKEFGWFE